MKVSRLVVLAAAMAAASAQPLRAEWLPIGIVQQASREHCIPAVIVFGHDYCPYTQPARKAHDADAMAPGGAGILRAYVDILSPEGEKLAESWCVTTSPTLVFLECGEEAWRALSPQDETGLAALERRVFDEGLDWNARRQRVLDGSAAVDEALELESAFRLGDDPAAARAVCRRMLERGEALSRAERMKVSGLLLDVSDSDEIYASVLKRHLAEFPEDRWKRASLALALIRLRRPLEARDEIVTLLADFRSSAEPVDPRLRLSAMRAAFDAGTGAWPELGPWLLGVLEEQQPLQPDNLDYYLYLAAVAGALDRPGAIERARARVLALGGDDPARRAALSEQLAPVDAQAAELTARIKALPH